jgi:CRP/FNR family transcriptional regulator, cyclic AMP receptor protein
METQTVLISAEASRAWKSEAGKSEAGRIVNYASEARIINQGDACDRVMFIAEGRVRLSIETTTGRGAIVGTVGAGAFLGEEAVAGRSTMLETATAMTDCRMRVFSREEFTRLLQDDERWSRKFTAHLIYRRMRLEADLADQLTNPAELRLARRLCLLARECSQDDTDQRVPPGISQSLLADMVGTTRPRVNHFLARFKKLGFIQYDQGIRVDKSLRKLLVRA